MKIAFFKAKGVIAPHVMDGFVDAFKMLGHKVFVFDFSTDNHLQQFSSLSSFSPDLAVGYGSLSLLKAHGEFFFRQQGIPSVLLHYDAPCYVFNKEQREEIKNNPSYYLNLVWDKSFIDLLRRAGIENLHPVKLATNPALFFPADKPQTGDAVCFVGNISSPAAPAQLQAAAGESFLRQVIERKAENIGRPVLEIMREIFLEPEYAAVSDAYRDDEQRFWHDYHCIHSLG